MAIPILDVGCGISTNLNSALSTIDDMINDIINGIGDITGAIASAVSSAIGDLGTALGKMLPDISGLIPDISLSSGIESLLDLVEGSVAYLAKLAELTLQFGESLLSAGLSIFDMVADALAAKLKGLNPCSALSTDLALTAAGVVPKPFNISFSTVAGIAENAAPKALVNNITKPKQLKYDIDIGITLADDIVITPEDILVALDEVDSNLDSLGKAINDNVYGN